MSQNLHKTLKLSNSNKLFSEAKALMPGGVNSPVRAFKSINDQPIFVKKAKGCRFLDADANEFIDYVGSWGPMIMGHADPDIEAALMEALKNGTSFGAPTEIENKMAAKVIELVPAVEMVRMVNSGTEAVMSAIRLARAFTAQQNPTKTKIVKFTGCYHGHVDALLAQAGSGVATLGMPGSSGITERATQDTILVPYNDFDAINQAFEKYSDEISAVILEPIIGNAGFILPLNGFLEHLRKITNENNSLLIFDEVMTGFRVALGGAQQRYNIKPDITCLGKIIGGGLPVGAYGGRKDIMEMVAPLGPMYQAGTLSGNPLAMTAGYTALSKLQKANYGQLEAKLEYMKQELSQFENLQFNYAGGMFGFFLSSKPIHNYEQAQAELDPEQFKKFYLAMLELGVYLAPSAFEAGFVSFTHAQHDIDKTIQAFKDVLLNL